MSPASARNVSPIRLALTLGIRGASYDWTILTDASCMPSSPHWLTHMAEACSKDENTQIVLGITRFVEGKGWHGLRCRFFRAWQEMLNFSYAKRHGAYRADGTNLAYRRSLFLEHRGFADHSNLLVGATEIMVNRHSTRQNTALCLHPDAIMFQDTPQYRGWWSQERLFFMETRRHFRHAFLFRLRYLWSIILTWVPTLLAIATVAAGLYLKNHIAVAIAVVLWTAYNSYLIYRFNKKAKTFVEQPFTFSYTLLSHLIPWWDVTAWLHWLFTKRRTFQKKFI